MRDIRTDLAVEAHEYYVGDKPAAGGVDVENEFFGDVTVTTVKITPVMC